MLREHYKNGEEDGLCEKWNKEGQIIHREIYKNGVLCEAFDDTGRVIYKTDQ